MGTLCRKRHWIALWYISGSGGRDGVACFGSHGYECQNSGNRTWSSTMLFSLCPLLSILLLIVDITQSEIYAWTDVINLQCVKAVGQTCLAQIPFVLNTVVTTHVATLTSNIYLILIFNSSVWL